MEEISAQKKGKKKKKKNNKITTSYQLSKHMLFCFDIWNKLYKKKYTEGTQLELRWSELMLTYLWIIALGQMECW